MGLSRPGHRRHASYTAPMEDPEAYLRALTAPLAQTRKGEPRPVVRFSLEAVANAFVILGLLPEARAEQILAEQRPVLESAGFRVGSWSPATHEGSGSFWFWPPVSSQAKQLRVTVSTLWEAAWALIDIPGR